MGMERPQKITFAEMRSSGVRGLLVYCLVQYSKSPNGMVNGGVCPTKIAEAEIFCSAVQGP